jgi:hypothetical protein
MLWPVGLSGRLGVAGGVLGQLLCRHCRNAPGICCEDAALIGVDQILELAHVLEQSEPTAMLRVARLGSGDAAGHLIAPAANRGEACAR